MLLTTEQLNEIKLWNEAVDRIKQIDEYDKLKIHHTNICNDIEQLTKDILEFTKPRGPREDIIQKHEKIKLNMLVKQRDRMLRKITELEVIIKKNIEETL